MKYFLFSDTHGINPNIVSNRLSEKGYDPSNKNHCVVIAGDLADGLGNEDNLINLIRSFKNKIVVKGNHDLGDDKIMWWHNNDYINNLSAENIIYMCSLKYQLESPDFYVAHGLYINNESVNTEEASVWASPVLFGKHIKNENWVYINPESVKKIRAAYDNSIDKYADSFDKTLFLGHFSEAALIKYTKEADYKLEVNSQGFYQYKNIIWLDKRVVEDQNNFDIYVMEVKDER